MRQVVQIRMRGRLGKVEKGRKRERAKGGGKELSQRNTEKHREPQRNNSLTLWLSVLLSEPLCN